MATLRLSRTFAASPERVFRAWTEPEALRRWLSPGTHETAGAEVDLRVGGTYRVAMRRLADGVTKYVTGTYREIRAPERLAFTWRWEDEPSDGETLVTVELRDLGGATEMVLTHERFASEASRDGHAGGWAGCLDKLATALHP
jgi:uncharacterized protein YndB with AHSA1/START domain